MLLSNTLKFLLLATVSQQSFYNITATNDNEWDKKTAAAAGSLKIWLVNSNIAVSAWPLFTQRMYDSYHVLALQTVPFLETTKEDWKMTPEQKAWEPL